MSSEKRNNVIFECVAKTFAGLEDVLVEELKSLGAINPTKAIRAVEFEADTETIYRLNYCCRTALRILKKIHSFKANNEDELYQGVLSIAWDKIMGLTNTFAVDAVVLNSNLKHSRFAALKAKDAVADWFRKNTLSRPYVNKDNPDVLIHLHISNNYCTLLIDTSLDALYRRGYRKSRGEAPINEVLAAGLIKLSGWNGKTPFVDFMCGSGTFLVEAAMISSNIPAGYYRKKFGFMKWPDFNQALWDKVRMEADEKISDEVAPIAGCDIKEEVYTAASENIRFAKLHKDIRIERCAFQDFKHDFKEGIVITNPPYGERLKISNLKELYTDLGNVLKKKYPNFEAWLITSDANNLIKNIGLRPSKKIKVFNGQLECRFVRYSLWEGSLKNKDDVQWGEEYDE